MWYDALKLYSIYKVASVNAQSLVSQYLFNCKETGNDSIILCWIICL